MKIMKNHAKTWKMVHCQKSQISIFFNFLVEIFTFWPTFFENLEKKSSRENFFFAPKKYFRKIIFLELKKKLGYSFDAEKAYLSIGDIFRAISATSVALEDRKDPWYKSLTFFPYIEHWIPPISEIFWVW